MECCRRNCYTDSETGDLYCPAFGGWQIGGCPMKNDANENENENKRNDDDE